MLNIWTLTAEPLSPAHYNRVRRYSGERWNRTELPLFGVWLTLILPLPRPIKDTDSLVSVMVNWRWSQQKVSWLWRNVCLCCPVRKWNRRHLNMSAPPRHQLIITQLFNPRAWLKAGKFLYVYHSWTLVVNFCHYSIMKRQFQRVLQRFSGHMVTLSSGWKAGGLRNGAVVVFFEENLDHSDVGKTTNQVAHLQHIYLMLWECWEFVIVLFGLIQVLLWDYMAHAVRTSRFQ